jgi:hypothetical protein
MTTSEILVQKAIAHNRNLLTFSEFIEVTEYKVDKYMIDKFFNSIKDDMPIYLDNDLIKWCGYAGELRDQKQNLLNLIKRYGIKITKYNNNEFDKFRNSNLKLSEYYPAVDRSNGKSKTIHILIMPKDLQLVLLILPTSIGHIIAEHYVNLSDLIKLYWRYQATFYSTKFENEIDKVCKMKHNADYSKLQKIKQLELDLEQKYRIGCIYFIYEDNDRDYFKIGWCYNLPDRMASLQTGNRRKLKVYKKYFTSFAYNEEQRLHNLFSKNRINGEWFKVSTNEIDAIIEN